MAAKSSPAPPTLTSSMSEAKPVSFLFLVALISKACIQFLIDGQMILKYQVVSGDLDALVSVKSDEDVGHMFDEINHCENTGAPRLRTFLFPANPLVMENQVGNIDPQALKQGYIDAINGIVRFTTMQHGSSLLSSGSGCSSPRSPDSCTTTTTTTTTEAMNNETNNYQSSTRLNVHRVQSSPSIVHQPPPPPQFYRKLLIDAHKSVAAPERLISVRSVGRVEGVRYQVDPAPQYYRYSASRQNHGSGICAKCLNHDDGCSSHCLDRRTGSLSNSPVPLRPLNGHCGMKPWVSTMGGDV